MHWDFGLGRAADFRVSGFSKLLISVYSFFVNFANDGRNIGPGSQE